MLQVSERVPAGVEDIILHIYPEGHDHIHDEWGAHGDKRGIDKKQADT
jgi:hypothetical protein